jgi:hypothetical protein
MQTARFRIFSALALLLLALDVSAQSQTDRFEILCTSAQPNVPARRFTVFIFVNGTEVTDHAKQPAVDYPAEAYVNALLWTDGKSKFKVDRFTGVLEVQPEASTFACEKSGGRKF